MLRPVRLRRPAAEDLEHAARYLHDHAGAHVASAFVGAIEASLAEIARHPHPTSLRFAFELDIPNLRAKKLEGHPYVILYREAEEIDVWRVLHTRRDLPAALAVVDDK